MPSAEEMAFLARIREQLDDGPRLIFADWLDERGDPRGEFIRLQCALAHLSADDPRCEALRNREQELKDAHLADWTKNLPGLDTGCEFRRGLLETVTIDAQTFVERGQDLFRMGPIRRVLFRNAAKCFVALMDSKWLGQIRELDLTNCSLGNNDITLLARARQLSRLEVLGLGFNHLTDQSLRTLADVSHLVDLRELSLNDNRQISTPGVRALADSPNFGNLRLLDLSGNGLSETALKVLINGEHLKRLEALALQTNNIGDGGVEALAHSELLGRMLTRSPVLDLSRNNIGPLGARALAESPLLEPLEVLNLDSNSIGDAGLASLAQSPYLGKLKRLKLRENRIGDTGVRAVARSCLPRTLEFIDLHGNFVTSDSTRQIDEATTAFDWRKKITIEHDPGLHLRAVRPGPSGIA
jgi:uncharacterized protein (TIGR02996 family)